MPDRKSAATDIPLVDAAYMIMGMLGGMMGPRAAAPDTTPAPKSMSYSFFITGSSADPMAEASATAEPLTPDRIMPATTFTWAMPPRICPTRASANFSMRSRIPVESINSPASMKNGMAMRTKESTPVNIRWGMR